MVCQETNKHHDTMLLKRLQVVIFFLFFSLFLYKKKQFVYLINKDMVHGIHTLMPALNSKPFWAITT